jgi:hypothetical protein
VWALRAERVTGADPWSRLQAGLRISGRQYAKLFAENDIDGVRSRRSVLARPSSADYPRWVGRGQASEIKKQIIRRGSTHQRRCENARHGKEQP